ncbi:unnamed protein product [Allacma fusca]|uniref:Uncharacterized protein n=1 Tax=Allacma fusca TaxID=39272 RepID=A0A8J2PDM6_9HEXA|nr:unnamed protein product [Allacma fusca]
MDNPALDLKLEDFSPTKTSTQNFKSSQNESSEELLYGIDDKPPWYMCLFLALQHYLEMIGATVACPFFLAPAMCMAEDDPDKASLISTLVFMSGIITILQSTFGTRLPIVQGGSYSYLVPCLAIMKLPQWQCPNPDIFNAMNSDERTELWQVRMRELQGAIIFAALFETVFAFTGIIGYMLRFLTPLAVAPAISLIGISLFRHAASEASKNYAVSISLLVLLVVFSQHLRNIKIPILCGKRNVDGTRNKFPLFQVFPVLLSVGIVWAVCAILTVTDVLPEGNAARTDSKINILNGSPWFRVPYPFQWGWPTVSLGAVIGLLCGIMTSTIESLGDYYACATIAKTPTPPLHAMNRGIFMEGFGCVLSGFWGSGNGSTSYSNNIGTISVTRVASRRVIQISGIIMIVLGLVSKAGAIFVSLPDPIVAGMFLLIFPLTMAVGIGTLAEVSLESARNIFIVSFAIFMGLTISQWSNEHPGLIQTGNISLDSLFQIILSTGMFVAGFIGFVLDNTIPGTDEERGLSQRAAAERAAILAGDETYNLPFGMDFIKRQKWMRYLPISPTYDRHIVQLLPWCTSKTLYDFDENERNNHKTSVNGHHF